MDKLDMFDAVAYGDLDDVKEVLDADPSLVNARDFEGKTPLNYAAIWESDEIAEYLLDHGANVNDRMDSGFTPLFTAVLNRRVRLTKLLVSRGADVHATEYEQGASVLHMAAAGGDADIIEFLLSKGVQIDFQKEGGWTPLHGAAFGGNLDAVKVLIAAGASIHSEAFDGTTPLGIAEEVNREEVVQFLESIGAKGSQQGEESAEKSSEIDEKEASDNLQEVTTPIDEMEAPDNLQPLLMPLIDCPCDQCGNVNWGQPDGSEIDFETDWLNLNRVLMCLSCGRKGIIDAATHKEAAAAAGVDVPDSYLSLGLSAQDYLNSVQRYLEEE